MKKSSPSYWLYGRHAVAAALSNPLRRVRRAIATRNSAGEYGHLLKGIPCEVIEPKLFAKYLGGEAVHQGIAVEVEPLAQPVFEDVLDSGKPLIMLDQVSDPHNVGAILRSACAFDLAGVIVHDRHAPKESGTMAKAASGALDQMPLVSVNNIANALDILKAEHYWCIGLDGEAKTALPAYEFVAQTVIVMGAEGKGLRRLTAERCDQLVRLPMDAAMESLNVSNAAAITLYTLYCQLQAI